MSDFWPDNCSTEKEAENYYYCCEDKILYDYDVYGPDKSCDDYANDDGKFIWQF
jgi:hypothetical protein